MRLGLSTYTYTWAVGVSGSMPDIPLTAEGLIDKAAEQGIGLVQFADNLPLEKMEKDSKIILNLCDYIINKLTGINDTDK